MWTPKSAVLIWGPAIIRENTVSKIIDCESLFLGLASGQGSVMIFGLLVNTGAKHGASIYGLPLK